MAALQDIGMLFDGPVLGDEYGRVYESATSHTQLRDLERQILGADHAEVGGMLAEQWKLPALLSTPIRRIHHAPQRVADPGLRKIAELVIVEGLAATCS